MIPLVLMLIQRHARTHYRAHIPTSALCVARVCEITGETLARDVDEVLAHNVGRPQPDLCPRLPPRWPQVCNCWPGLPGGTWPVAHVSVPHGRHRRGSAATPHTCSAARSSDTLFALRRSDVWACGMVTCTAHRVGRCGCTTKRPRRCSRHCQGGSGTSGWATRTAYSRSSSARRMTTCSLARAGTTRCRCSY